MNKSPIAAAASSDIKKLNIDPDTFVGDRIAGKIGELTFFGNVLSHRWLHYKKLWFIQYDCGDVEDVTMKQLMERQQLFWEEKDDDIQGGTKPRGRWPTAPPSMVKRKNTTT